MTVVIRDLKGKLKALREMAEPLVPGLNATRATSIARRRRPL
jgi:hypothetical protein